VLELKTFYIYVSFIKQSYVNNCSTVLNKLNESKIFVLLHSRIQLFYGFIVIVSI
jgi:hypothetical protein